MFRSIVSAIALGLVVAAGPGRAQVVIQSGQLGPAASAADTEIAGKRPCRGRLKGRFRITLNDPLTICTLEIGSEGKVRAQRQSVTKCTSTQFAPVAITGGQLELRAPLPNPRVKANRCFVSGVIELREGEIKIHEAFIWKRNAGFSGVAFAFGQKSGTAFSAIRY